MVEPDFEANLRGLGEDGEKIVDMGAINTKEMRKDKNRKQVMIKEKSFFVVERPKAVQNAEREGVEEEEEEEEVEEEELLLRNRRKSKEVSEY